MENVSWNDAQDFINKLNKKEAGNKYRLPTEAEWEYAARAGSTGDYCFGDDSDQLGDYAWYGSNSGGSTHPVGTKKPNALGLYDMHGNVYEWCFDWYRDNYYRYSPRWDPQGPSAGSYRVLRGGGWDNYPNNLRSASRSSGNPTIRLGSYGFRVARDY